MITTDQRNVMDDIESENVALNTNDGVNSDLKSDAATDSSPNYNEGDDKSSSSETSEIARLADVSISDDIFNTAEVVSNDAEANKQREIHKVIKAVQLLASTSLDLSKRKLQTFPESLSQIPQLEYMYLEGNEIISLPDEFFKMFPNLRWLDLRNNLLSRIPSAHLASHSCLRDLLLEGNNLRNLPLELGLVKSLQGLNISGNPLDFPPQEIIEKGTQYILSFLRDLYEISSFHPGNLDLNMSEEAPYGCEQVSVSTDDWNTTASMMDLAKKREMLFKHQSELNGNPEHAFNQASDAKSGKPHKPPFYANAKSLDFESAHKMISSLDFNRKKRKDSKLSWRINPFPPIPTQEYVTHKLKEEIQMAKVKKMKEKIDAIIQKQKDEAVRKKWRDVTKVLQQKKYAQHLLPGKDYQEPGEQAPFGIEAEMMKVLSKEDRLKADIQREAELKRQRAVSPTTKMRKEREKQKRIIELEQMVQVHTTAMLERRKLPKGTPQQEMELARRELQIAEQLHSELQAQRRDVEYNIKTFPPNASKRANRTRHHVLK